MSVTSKSDIWTDFDPRDTSMFASGDIDAIFARLRECNSFAVSENGPVPIYSLVRYADVSQAYKEPEAFSPTAGLTLDSFDPARSEAVSPMLEMAPSTLHGELRRAMQSVFREPHLRELEEKTRDSLARFLTDSANDEVVDFVEALARPAASEMMAGLLGVPQSDRLRLDPFLRAAAEIGVGAPRGSGIEREGTELGLLRELTRIVRAHRQEQRPAGLIASLLDAEIAGEPLTDHEIALNCLNVVIAGMGASQHSLAGAAAAWAQHPAELERAVDGGFGSELIDETLRWLTPVVHLTRILTQDVEISGQELPQGACVCLWNISANRDEEVFEEAHAFRPDRPLRRNLAFGTGPQHCLGAQVVRMQLGVLLAGMREHRVRLELNGPPMWIRSNTIRGVERLPILVRRVGAESTAK